jgi:hypothetical protein
VHMPEQKFRPKDLSGEANFALVYVQASLSTKGSPQWYRLQAGIDHLNQKGITLDDRRAALRKGMTELLERGIIEAKRDGEGEWVPTVFHEEMLEPDTLVMMN